MLFLRQSPSDSSWIRSSGSVPYWKLKTCWNGLIWILYSSYWIIFWGSIPIVRILNFGFQTRSSFEVQALNFVVHFVEISKILKFWSSDIQIALSGESHAIHQLTFLRADLNNFRKGDFVEPH